MIGVEETLHDFTESDRWRDICAHIGGDGRMCGAPEVHPWHGHATVEVSVPPDQRDKWPQCEVCGKRYHADDMEEHQDAHEEESEGPAVDLGAFFADLIRGYQPPDERAHQ